jgi:thioredoxin-like negative regulator of GroEL
LLVVKLNTEEFPRIAQTFQIASIPTFVVLRNGQEMNRRSGALPASALQQLAFSARV